MNRVTCLLGQAYQCALWGGSFPLIQKSQGRWGRGALESIFKEQIAYAYEKGLGSLAIRKQELKPLKRGNR